MTSSKDQPVRKAWQEYSNKMLIKSIKIIFFSIQWIIRYSGLEFIYRKFNPPKNPQILPTGFIWLIGIYVAFYGVASQRYENRIDIIENRANSIFNQLAVPSVAKNALSRISGVQNMPCPYKPNILNPPSVFISLFRDSNYEEMIEQLKDTIENWKGSLDSVDLQEVDLRGADLREANLREAKLRGAKLKGAKLKGADLRGANLQGANLQEAKLEGADLWGANFRGANFEGADLWGANLRGANLQEADLEGFDLRGTNLKEADLWGANLRGADLRGANLREAKLRGANFEGANLRGANFRATNLKEAENLTVDQLCEARTVYPGSLHVKLVEQINKQCSRLLKNPQITKKKFFR